MIEPTKHTAPIFLYYTQILHFACISDHHGKSQRSNDPTKRNTSIQYTKCKYIWVCAKVIISLVCFKGVSYTQENSDPYIERGKTYNYHQSCNLPEFVRIYKCFRRWDIRSSTFTLGFQIIIFVLLYYLNKLLLELIYKVSKRDFFSTLFANRLVKPTNMRCEYCL